MTEKRYRTEQIEGATLPFIVDNYSAKKLNEKHTGYKAYETTTVKKCDELTDLLNELQDKSDKKQKHIVLLEGKIHRMREDIKRLEALYHYGGYIGSGDVKKEYYRREKLLKAENEQLKQEVESINSKNKILLEYCDDLQERNDRQVKQLDNIYNLIEKQDWETLTGLIQEFKECEEQLKIEMECYDEPTAKRH